MTLEEFRKLHAPNHAEALPVLALSWHARKRSQELGFTQAEIAECLTAPEQSYPSHVSYGPDRRTCQRGHLCVVIDNLTQTVITVLLRTQRTWVHGVDDRHTA